ncbi:hypothetical protein TrRE_jg13613, partial [Triparma retinervis]
MRVVIKIKYGKIVPPPSRVSKRTVEKSPKLKDDEAFAFEVASLAAARALQVRKPKPDAFAGRAEAKKKKKKKPQAFGADGMTYLPKGAEAG